MKTIKDILKDIAGINNISLTNDEILSFWVADPSVSFIETLNRHNELEVVPVLFNLILIL